MSGKEKYNRKRGEVYLENRKKYIMKSAKYIKKREKYIRKRGKVYAEKRRSILGKGQEGKWETCIRKREKEVESQESKNLPRKGRKREK